MKLRLIMADPAGNRTALVLTRVPREDYAPLAAELLAREELRAEQVGYCLPPSREGSAGRLEMMGGEFCGNAARSFGLLLARERGGGRQKVPVEVSGCPRLLPVEADPEAGLAESPMPLPRALEELEVPGLGLLPAVLLEGITHVLLPGVPPSEEICLRVREAASRRWDWEALGTIFLGEGGFLTPVVAVRATGSAVWESSCASGSTAAAVWLARDLAEGARPFRFPQPGGVIAGMVEKTAGRVLRVTVGGPVGLEEPLALSL